MTIGANKERELHLSAIIGHIIALLGRFVDDVKQCQSQGLMVVPFRAMMFKNTLKIRQWLKLMTLSVSRTFI
ncbi:MAG: hypothetical protein ACPHSE_02460 [Flavobacteriaceae bacterium]